MVLLLTLFTALAPFRSGYKLQCWSAIFMIKMNYVCNFPVVWPLLSKEEEMMVMNITEAEVHIGT